MRAAIYVRLSKDRPEETSTERQEADCRKLAEARGWEVAAVYQDLLSAWNQKVRRADFERMLADAEAGAFDVVLVWKLDRFARSVLDFHRALRRLDAVGVAFASLSDSVDTSTPMGKFTVTLTSALAELESDTISYRVRAANTHAAQAGKPHAGGGRRFGYTRSMEVDPAEAAMAREAAAHVIAGGSVGQLARDWSARGARTPGGHEWSVRAIVQTLKSPHLAGLRTHQGRVTSGAWPAVITPDEHAAVRAVFSRRTKGGTSGRDYLLTGGLVCCGTCGTALAAHPRQGVRNYWCPKRPGFDGCGGVQVLADPVEELVRNVIWASMDTPEFRAGLRPGSDRTGDAGRLAREVEGLSARLDQARNDYYVDGLIERAEFLTVKAELESRLAQAQYRLAEAQGVGVGPAAGLTADDVRALWDTWSREQRRAMVRVHWQRVVVHPVGRGRRRPAYARVSLVDREGASWTFTPEDEERPLTLWHEEGRQYLRM